MTAAFYSAISGLAVAVTALIWDYLANHRGGK